MINTYYQDLNYAKISQNKSYQNLLLEAYNKWRYASNYICDLVLNKAFAEKYNIAHGTTSTAPDKIMASLYEKLKIMGYKITLLLCYADSNTRLATIKHRAEKQAFVQSSDADVINKGQMFPNRFPVYFQYADNILLYWTPENFLQEGSVLAATWSKSDGLQVENESAYKSFMAKYKSDTDKETLPTK